MKIKWIIVISLIAVFALSACQSTETAGTQDQGPDEGISADQPVDETSSQEQEEIAYPGPVVEDTTSSDAYPDPLYPEVTDGGEVQWDQATAMLKNGEVRTLTLQSETMRVTMALKDGRLLVVVVVNSDQVHSTLASCGEVCKTVIFKQE